MVRLEVKGVLSGNPNAIDIVKIFKRRWSTHELTIKPFIDENNHVVEFVWNNNGVPARRNLYIHNDIDHIITSGVRVIEPFAFVFMSADNRSFEVIEYLVAHYGGYMMDDRPDTPLGEQTIWKKFRKESDSKGINNI